MLPCQLTELPPPRFGKGGGFLAVVGSGGGALVHSMKADERFINLAPSSTLVEKATHDRPGGGGGAREVGGGGGGGGPRDLPPAGEGGAGGASLGAIGLGGCLPKLPMSTLYIERIQPTNIRLER